MQDDPKCTLFVVSEHVGPECTPSIETLGSARPSSLSPKARSIASFSPSTPTTSRTFCQSVLGSTPVLLPSATLSVEADPAPRIGLWCVFGDYVVHWAITINTAMIADLARCRSRRSPSGVDPGYAFVHDWDSREQDYTRSFDGSGEASASHSVFWVLVRG